MEFIIDHDEARWEVYVAQKDIIPQKIDSLTPSLTEILFGLT